MEWNGMEWDGMGWDGMEWDGMEWNGMEWNGMEWNGTHCAALLFGLLPALAEVLVPLAEQQVGVRERRRRRAAAAVAAAAAREAQARLGITVQYSTVQCSTVQCSTVQYSTVQCSTVQHSTAQYSTAQYIHREARLASASHETLVRHRRGPERTPFGRGAASLSAGKNTNTSNRRNKRASRDARRPPVTPRGFEWDGRGFGRRGAPPLLSPLSSLGRQAGLDTLHCITLHYITLHYIIVGRAGLAATRRPVALRGRVTTFHSLRTRGGARPLGGGR